MGPGAGFVVKAVGGKLRRRAGEKGGGGRGLGCWRWGSGAGGGLEKRDGRREKKRVLGGGGMAERKEEGGMGCGAGWTPVVCEDMSRARETGVKIESRKVGCKLE